MFQNKGADQLHSYYPIHFTYAKSRFSHNVAHWYNTIFTLNFWVIFVMYVGNFLRTK